MAALGTVLAKEFQLLYEKVEGSYLLKRPRATSEFRYVDFYGSSK